MSKWFLEVRGRVPKKARILLGMVPILLLLGLWWFCTCGPVEERRIGPAILPSPGEVVRSLGGLLVPPVPADTMGQGVSVFDRMFKDDRSLFYNTMISLKRVGLGFLLALVVVVPVGVGMGAFGTVRAMFNPSSTASGYIPIATLVPLTMSWFGIGELQKVFFLALAFGIFLLPQVVTAIEKVPEVYLRTASTLGATRMQTVFRVLVPVAMPDIWHAMRLAFGVGWTYLVLTEVVVLERGLGALVAIAQRRGPREHIYLVIVTITLIAWGADLLWVWLGRKLFPYQRSET